MYYTRRRWDEEKKRKAWPLPSDDLGERDITFASPSTLTILTLGSSMILLPGLGHLALDVIPGQLRGVLHFEWVLN